MQHLEFPIKRGPYEIAVSLKIPEKGNGRAIDLFHGAFINKESLSRRGPSIATDLCEQGYVTLAADSPLHGETKVPENYQVRFKDLLNAANITVDYLHGMGLEVYAAGHSMGGMIASGIAGNEKIKALSLIQTPAIRQIKHGTTMYSLFKIASLIPLEMLPFRSPLGASKISNIPLQPFMTSDFFDDETLKYLEVMEGDPEYKTKTYPPEYPIKFMSDMTNQKPYELLLRSKKPSLVIFGEEDKTTSSITQHPIFKEGAEYGNMKMVIVPGGHIRPCRKEPEYFRDISKELGQFFSEV